MKESAFAGVALTQSTILFVSLLPDPDTLKNNGSPYFVANIRTREFAAGSLSLATGVGLSLIGKDWTPFAIALVTTISLILMSEFLIRSQPNTGGSPS